MIFQRGDTIWIELDGEDEVAAVVVLSSQNGRSLMVDCGDRAFYGGYVQYVPLFDRQDNGCHTDLVCDRLAVLKPRAYH